MGKGYFRQYIASLETERLAIDWCKYQKTRAGVQLAIQKVLDSLPPKYESDLYEEKCALVYQHVFDAYFGAGKSVYSLIV
jgi:type I restriction enzyme R subunit